MFVNILFFGPIKDITGNGNLVMADMPDTDSVVAALKSQFPGITNARFVLAVDKQIVQQNTALRPDSTVALMPAFSGG